MLFSRLPGRWRETTVLDAIEGNSVLRTDREQMWVEVERR
jgi:hypothetical protein